MVGQKLSEAARLASLEDLDLLVFLQEQAVAEVMEKRGGEVLLDISPLPQKTHTTHFLLFWSLRTMTLIVGLFEDVIVGYGHLEFSMTNSNKKMASLKEIFVLKDARSVGGGVHDEFHNRYSCQKCVMRNR